MNKELIADKAEEYFQFMLDKEVITSADYEPILARLGALTIITLNLFIGRVYKAEKAEIIKRTYLRWLQDNLK